MEANTLDALAARLRTRQAHVAIIGLGYVGLPLAVEFAKAGFRVTGLELDRARAHAVNAGRSYILDVPGDELAPLVRERKLRATANAEMLAQADAIIICVPTPLRKTREPDVSFILSAAEMIGQHIHRGQLVVLESTTYPGTTQEILQTRFEANGLKAGTDFGLAFSPERVDPGNPQFTTKNIPKVVGGVTPRCTQLAQLLYGQVIQRVVPVSSPRVAEMVKLLENTFRSVNIGLVNEMALMCHTLGINVWEVIEAAKTKPFGFMAFYPGPGLGGHCIPSDPIYLSWKARMHGFEARFIELAAQINGYMPHHVVDRVAAALNDVRKPLKGSRVLLLGLAYKPDVGDTRDSPALEILRFLHERGAVVSYHDPYVPSCTVEGKRWTSAPFATRLLRQQDCVVIVTNHRSVNYRAVVQSAPLVLDTRNQLRDVRSKHIVRL